MQNRIVTMFAVVAFICVMSVANVGRASVSASLVKGCVGECGPTSITNYDVPVYAETNQEYVVKQIESSLCPNTGARAQVFRNAVLIASADLTHHDSAVSFTASPGDMISMVVWIYDTGKSIACVRLGVLHYGLEQESK